MTIICILFQMGCHSGSREPSGAGFVVMKNVWPISNSPRLCWTDLYDNSLEADDCVVMVVVGLSLDTSGNLTTVA